MSSNESRRNLPVYRHMHPTVYGLMAALAAGSVLAIWLFFNDGGGATLSLIVVGAFAVAFIVTPYVLWRASPRRNDPRAEAKTLSNWLEGEFEADRGVIEAKDAMAMALLLPAAFAVSISAISFIAYLASVGAL